LISLYDELSEKIQRDPRMSARNSARQNLGVMLFAWRDDIAALWKAAAASLEENRCEGVQSPSDELRLAVEKLRPLFGER
jgi:hypothetical protein